MLDDLREQADHAPFVDEEGQVVDLNADQGARTCFLA